MEVLHVFVLALFLCGSFAQRTEEELREDRELVRAIYLDSLKMKEEMSKPRLPQVGKSVCFDEIGCFSKIEGPFNFTSLQPESPEQIQTKFSLFTRHNANSPYAISYVDKGTLNIEWLDPSQPFAVISHGLNENDGKTWIKNLKNGLLNKGYSSVLVLDWGKGAMLPFYGQAMVNSEVVGRQLAYILELLHKQRGLRMDTVHLLGYSLGAHLSGFAGKTLRDKLGLRVGRITGLDPAGPTFEDKNHRVHLSDRDADFVDVIHSSAGGTSILVGDLGIVKAIGHVDFYPNGGKKQPGCGFFDITCSHRRANELFIESLSSSNCNFLGYSCEGGYEAFQQGQCRQCDGENCGILGLQSAQGPARGSLYLSTKGGSPYCEQSA